MKKLFTLLIAFACAIAAHSQLTATNIGIPQSVYDDLSTVVFTQQFEQCSDRAPGYGGMELVKMTVTKNGVKTTKVVITETKYYKPGIRQNVGAYALNLFRMDLYDFGYKNITATDSGYVLSSNSGMRAIYWQKNGVWYQQKLGVDYGMQLRDPITRVSRRYSESELISNYTYVKRGTNKELPITSEMLKKWSENYRIGDNYDPGKYVCNVFTRIVNTGPGVYKGEIFVNGINIDNINEGALITSFGKTGMSFTPRWKFLNGCAKGDGNDHPVPLNEYGNAGTCDAIQGTNSPAFLSVNVIADTQFSYEQGDGLGNGDVFYYDSSKPFWLWFQAESYQAQGKNEGSDSFYDISNGVVKHNLFN